MMGLAECQHCQQHQHAIASEPQQKPAEGLEPRVDAIFAIFATTADSFLDAAQYRTYLKGIGEWAQLECYTDTTWTTKWPAACGMLWADPEKGVDLTAFRRMYMQYRQDKVILDHARTVAVAATTANIGCVAQQHEPSRTVGKPSPPGSPNTVWDHRSQKTLAQWRGGLPPRR